MKEPVTIQCDASQTGLGATLLQNGQPVAYASRGLSSAETRYAQIEKELLAIVFSCESEARWEQIEHASADDPVLQELRLMTQRGWPSNRSDVPQCLLPYFDIRDEKVVQGIMIVFKGHQLVVPAALRKEMMAATHSSHIGIEACIRRGRESLYWPRMTVELKEYIQHCGVCLTHRNEQGKEPLAHCGPLYAADLCQLEGRTLLVISYYYSNFIEVTCVTSITARSIIKELKAVFARFGIPDILVRDNGPQFVSSEFSVFPRTSEFKHVTSSPTYAQSNGKAENSVKTVKHLLKKCKDSGHSEYLALLDWQNTPTSGIGTSPAQRLMGRGCKTLLPIADKLL
ncbi:uncharacterized protein K02A2.6-like [Acropora millepora]|uniref:uncharacterized protein K02A2.6-like n=1 Tax=Acropora millepora TaxID=45264 RepID=UPI001CF30B1E|nr:uncharacterized protein K02A2.6-like [Acropora millepora]